MMIPPDIREQVRLRADFACEFCGVRENDAAGLLTIDHFQPKSAGGEDDLENLLYCCMRCNLYKSDYWPAAPDSPVLWNPRLELAAEHFIELDDGILHPLSTTGVFTLQRLRLNRPPLIAYRLNKSRQAEFTRLLEQYQDALRLLDLMQKKLADLAGEQQKLLKEQRDLLKRLLAKPK